MAGTEGHRLVLEERSRLMLTGATEVVSFEDSSVVLHTTLGTLSVHGQELKLQNLSLEGGQVVVEGNIAALIFQEPRGGGWLSRLFG